jgi:uncharacterized protein (DUF433 family)
MDPKRFTFAEGVPLSQDQDQYGSIRVTGSRVTLDTIVHRYQVGDSVADIHDGFPTVSIEQIKAILDWYHKHQAEADEYLHEGEAAGEKLRQEIESRPEYIAFREKIRCYREQRLKT